MRAAIEKGIDALKAAGCEVKPVSLPHTKYAIPTYYLVATAEASANLARFDGVRYGYRSPHSETLSAMYSHSRDEGFGAEVKRRILLGTYALSAGYYDAYYLKAQQVRRLLAEEFLRAFAEVDAIVTPTSPVPAFKLGEKTGDPLAMYLADIYTVTASLAGICGVTVPCGTTKAGLPVGMQVLARHFGEGTAFRVARAVEDRRSRSMVICESLLWHRKTRGQGRRIGSSGSERASAMRKTAVFVVLAVSFWVATASQVQAAPRKTHTVVLGAAKRVPYSKAGDPAGAAAGEDALKIRALLVDGVLKEWTTGDAHDVTDRSFVVRRVIRLNDALPERQTGERPGSAAEPLGVAARAVAAGGSRDRPRDRAQAARLRSRREPGELVSRLRGLLRRDGERQEPVRGGGAGGGAQAGAGQEARGFDAGESSRSGLRAARVAARAAAHHVSSRGQGRGELRHRSRVGGAGGRFGRRSRRRRKRLRPQ